MNAGAGVKGTFVTQEAAGFKGEKAQAALNSKNTSRALIVFVSLHIGLLCRWHWAWLRISGIHQRPISLRECPMILVNV